MRNLLVLEEDKLHGNKTESKEGQEEEASATLEQSNSEIGASCFLHCHLYGCHMVCARRKMRHEASSPHEYFIPYALSASQYDPEQVSSTCV